MKLSIKKAIANKNVDELKQQIKDSRKELLALKLDFARNKLKNSKAMFAKRKEIAQAATRLKEGSVKNG